MASSAAVEPTDNGEPFLAGGGEMGARIAAFDWSSTPLGPIAGWPQSLRSISAFVLHSPVPMVMLWGEDGIMLYNDGYAVFAGDRHPHLLGSKVREGWPEVADFNDNIMKVGLAGGTLAYKGHVLSLNRTGTFEDVWLDLDYSPVFDEDGAPAGVLAIVIETTEAVKSAKTLSQSEAQRAAAEAELRETAASLRELNETLEVRAQERSAALDRSQTQFRLLVQGVTDYAIYMLDPDGLVSSWNAGAERIKGFTPDEVIGQHFRAFYPAEDRDRGLPEAALDTALREGRFVAEGWRIRKDGTRFRASVVIDAIQDDDGALIGFAKITRDVTERDEAQRELELAREALFQSQKLEAIGQLTGGVAHDFNNLLMAIMSGLELLRKRVPADPKVTKLLDNAAQAADRGAKLTQRMLAFARRQELTAEQVNLPKLVAGMTELMQRSLGPQFTIDTSFSAGLAPALTDVNQLEMALLNLAVNARDAMPDGGRLTISATECQIGEGELEGVSPGRFIRLTVADNGSGMDPETLRRAADPFFTTKGVGKGTGLGLSMVHGFTRQMGGALSLESTPGKGTRAHIWLPAAAGAALFPAVLPEAVEVETGPTRNILVVDDDALVLMNTVAMLEDLGHRVFEALSGQEALAAFEEHGEIDLLVTDQAMPGMTGSELIAALRARRPELPVVLATGYGETPADIGAAVHRLGKPYNQADLSRALATACPD